MTVLHNELFVVRWEYCAIIEVYDATDDYNMLRHLTIVLHKEEHNKRQRGLSAYLSMSMFWSKTNSEPVCSPPRLTDIASCSLNDWLFVSDLANCAIHQLRPLDGSVIQSWAVEGGAYGLSVTELGTLLVCCTGSMQLVEFYNDGTVLRRVLLPDDCVQPWHVIKLTNDVIYSWIFCHGGRHWDQDIGRSVNDPLHRIYKVGQDVDEQDYVTCVRIHGHEPGSRDDQVCYPLYIAEVGSTGYLLVADCDNDRIKLLNKDLRSVRVILGPKEQVRAPHRLEVSHEHGQLLVGLASGVILAFSLRDILPHSVLYA